MSGAPLRLQPLVRARVARLGEAGAAWAADLPAVLVELAERWSLTWERPLPGGSSAYVVGARTSAGEQRVVKVELPDPELTDPAPVLSAAAGRGYVLLHDTAPEHRALLLERLGDSLERSSAAPEERVLRLVTTLRVAWAGVGSVVAVEVDDKAVQLAEMVERLDARHGHPLSSSLRRVVLAHAERLAGWAGETVTVHGDPHPGNLLRVLSPRIGAPDGWVLVDPDGFRADPAYDVGAALRDWSSHLRGPDAAARLRSWCSLAAEASDVDPDRTWAWAHLERVTTGLFLLDLGAPRVAAPFLEVAEALV
ncbi:aminoglycoside phosphotransferase family protein [Nocardioides nanhaiensis]|uniref:Streptomycin 6-kinase n=1 Tax=Nocardioides nanhaiensis TaxID=1476871 RepID=A0ABP8VY74_9ACTN